MGTVVPFRGCARWRFTREMRSSLMRFAARYRNVLPLRFGVDASGAEFCCLANGLTISWDRGCGLVLTDTFDGYVDRGPFHSLDEVCLFAAYLSL